MSANNTRLELKWPGKEVRPRLEPRILLEDSEKSHHSKHRMTEDDSFENRLIFGDNLLALKAVEQEYTGRIKCIYIDPPYNTGAAFTHYDDGLEHSIWLGMMRDRIEILRRLLRDDGVIFIHIDDNEQAYLKVLMDEIFGRRNFCGQIVWEKKKKPSFLNSNMGVVTEYILAYSPNRLSSPPFVGGLTTEGKKYPLNNAGNGVQVLAFPAGAVSFRCADGRYSPQDMSDGNIITRLLDPLIVDGGKNKNIFRLEGEWRYSQRKLDEIIAAGEQLVISKIPFRPNHIKKGGESKKLMNLLSIAHYHVSTYEDSNAESIALFGEESFDYPKPEMLLQILISSVTSPGDWILDSFAGSGTTGAVAHKMGRRWIMVELGEHCHTHIIPRLKKYILDWIRNNITHHRDNKLSDYIELGGRGSEYPLSYSTVEKTFYSFLIGFNLLSTRFNHRAEEGLNPRQLEIEQIVMLMNIIAEEVFIGKFDPALGTSRIESKVSKGEDIPEPHLIAYRLAKEEIVYNWLRYLKQVIQMAFVNAGIPFDENAPLQKPMPPNAWNNVRNFVISLKQLPLWVNRDIATSVFGGKRNNDFWKQIFEEGQTPDGQKVLGQRFDLIKMIQPQNP